MKRLTLSPAFLALFASVALADGVVYLRGPDDRGEGPLPLAVVDPMNPAGFGEFTVDVYAEDMPGFGGFQLLVTFLGRFGQKTSGFYVSYSTPNPEFGGRAIVHNTDFLPEIDHACVDQMVGLLSVEQFPPDSGDYVDKSIPPEEDLMAVNPPNMVWPGHEGLTWLMSVNYSYTSDVPRGPYTISVDEDITLFGGWREFSPVAIPFTVVTGSASLAMGWSDATGDVTGDCIVNVLDMIAVRNHMYEDPASGDNARYDLTGDGVINVLDMIVVRNNVRNRCPE